MKTTIQKFKIADIVNGFLDDGENGVVAFGGNLNVRPAYQREFVYGPKERDAVIDSVTKGLPLSFMYWGDTGNGTYELMDGQQRTLSICQYVNEEFAILTSLGPQLFGGLKQAVQQQIHNYEVYVCICQGTDQELLEWYRRINIAGKEHTEQELRNSVYTGTWLSDAKLKFSKTGCAAFNLDKDKGHIISGSPIQQDYLEQAIQWINGNSDAEICDYMAKHQMDPDATELWDHYQKVIAWVHSTFTVYRKEMKSVEWGSLYKAFSMNAYDATIVEKEVAELMEDEEVTSKSGIYEFVLTRDRKHLNLRAFTDKQKREAFTRQGGVCIKPDGCGKTFPIEKMEGDHIQSWVVGGKTDSKNCQMLCKKCNRAKGAKP